MAISGVEIIALLATGTVCGLSVLAGFALSALYQIYLKRYNKRLKEVAWILTMIAIMAGCTLGTVFIIATLVYSNNPPSELFWARLSVFSVGVFFGLTYAFISTRLIVKGLSKKPGSENNFLDQ